MKKHFNSILLKILIIFIMTSLAVSFCSCGKVKEQDHDKITIVSTAFAPYDWAKNIIKNSENVNLVLLNSKGTDIHSFQPSADDIITIKESDILIAIGNEADDWAIDAAKGSDVHVLNLMEIAFDNEDTHDDHHHEHTDDCDHAHTDIDEHIWMSLRLAIKLTEKISEEIILEDPENEELYISNTSNYVNQISDLDKRYEATVSAGTKNVIVVADRFPFVHLANDYKIDCYAAFPGCSSDTDASPETIISLAKKVDEYDIKYIAVTDGSSKKTATAVINNTKDKDMETVEICSMQSVSLDAVKDGVTYLSIAEENLSAIEKLLG